MKEADFNPYIRYIARIGAARPYPELICAYDHRMFYVAEGGFIVEFTDRSLELSAKNLLTIPPGVPYRLIFPENPAKLTYFILNFDFDSASYGLAAHTPQPAAAFDPDQIFSTAYLEPFGEIFLQRRANALEPFFEELYSESLDETPTFPPLSSALLKYILSRLASKKQRSSSPSDRLLADVKEYVKKNACSGVTNNAVAEHFDYHSYYLNSLFTKQEGITLHQYISNVRFQRAKELLSSTNLAIYEIASACGFQSASYFSEAFLKHEGITPSQYREFGK